MPLNTSNNSAVFVASSHLSKSQASTQNSIKKLASGKRNINPLSDPGMLSVSMKLKASATRLSGVSNNIQNAISFLEVQDGMLETAGRILNRMAEIKGMVTADPLKSEQDLESYDNEIKQLQVQMYQISQQTFNGVSLFANHTNGNVQHNGPWNTSSELVFEDTDLVGDGYGNGDLRNHHSISIHVSAEGTSGAKINIHKSALLAAITIESDDLNREDTGMVSYSFRHHGGGYIKNDGSFGNGFGHVWSFASENINDAWGESDDTDWIGNAPVGLGDAGISLGVYTQAMENVAFLRAENASQKSRLNFAADSLANYQSNMRAAVGRIEDVDIAQESSQLAKQQILTRAAASMAAQANSSYELVLTMLG